MKPAIRLTLLTIMFLMVTAAALADNGYRVDYQRDSSSTIELDFGLDHYNLVDVLENGNHYTKIEFNGKVATERKGYAKLPFLHSAVELPENGNFRLEIVDTQYEDHFLDHPLLPSKGVIYRGQDPAKVPLAVAPSSLTDRWYPGDVATIGDAYILRDVRGANVHVYPFQYNAQRRNLRVYTKVTVKLVAEFTGVQNPQIRPTTELSPTMDGIYRSVFINYDQDGNRADQVIQAEELGEVGEMLVIYTSRDATAIQPYIQWKQEKGFTVHSQEVAPGTNVKDIIKNAYDDNPAILYVQLVGDWADIKSDTGAGSDWSAPTDPMLGCVAGTDYYPDLIVGRFSANSAAHVTTQVNKTIAYEKTPDSDDSWYRRGVGIGSDEGAGDGDDGEADFEHIDIIKDSKLLPFIYSDVVEAYKNPRTSLVFDALDDGVGVVNYCGHGWERGWATSSFSNDDVADLNNGSKLPFIFSTACLNGAFHDRYDCFAEAWLRKENGGAVAVVMSTISQPWRPPMRGQDYFNDLLIGGYNYNGNPGSGISTSEGRSTFGSIVFNGLVLMYSESSRGSDLETIQSWTIFGDASLSVRTN